MLLSSEQIHLTYLLETYKYSQRSSKKWDGHLPIHSTRLCHPSWIPENYLVGWGVPMHRRESSHLGWTDVQSCLCQWNSSSSSKVHSLYFMFARYKHQRMWKHHRKTQRASRHRLNTHLVCTRKHAGKMCSFKDCEAITGVWFPHWLLGGHEALFSYALTSGSLVTRAMPTFQQLPIHSPRAYTTLSRNNATLRPSASLTLSRNSNRASLYPQC